MDAEHLPGDVAGLNQTQMKMIEGALKINELKVKDIMTKINHVTSLPLDAILDQQLLARIKQFGYSRIPLCQVQNEKIIIGIFLTKSLVGYEPIGESIIAAIRGNRIQVRPPIYFLPTANIQEVCSAFSKGVSHMGIVCENKQTAKYLQEASDQILSQLHDGSYQFEALEEHSLLGVLTLENVIERILSMNIHDEKDYDQKLKQKNRPQ